MTPIQASRSPRRRKTGPKTQTRKRGPTGAGSARRLAVRKKATDALELRLAGNKWEEIAKQVGYKLASTAYNAVSDMLDQIACERVEEYRILELARLDSLQAGHWKAAIAGNVAAGNFILRVMERRAKLLGLDPAEPMAMNFFQFNRTELSAHEHQHITIPADPEAQERIADHCRALESLLDAGEASPDPPALPG